MQNNHRAVGVEVGLDRIYDGIVQVRLERTKVQYGSSAYSDDAAGVA